MPIAHDNSSVLDGFKEPLYKLCERLVQLRRTPQGYGLRTEMSISLSQLRDIMEYEQGNTHDKIEKLRQHLLLLGREMIPNGAELRPLLVIPDEYVHDAAQFAEQFQSDRVLRMTYTSRDVDEYCRELLRRTQEQHRADAATTLTPQPGGGIVVSKGTKQMCVRRGRNAHNLSANIVSLMWGHPIELSTGESVSMEDEYERGDHVGYDELIDQLCRVTGGQDDSGSISRREVVSAVTRLNRRAECDAAFGTPIFQTDDVGLRWVL